MSDKRNQILMSLGALGVVFGDIGTSPLYALSEIFFAHSESVQLHENSILGVTSLIIWALTLIISVKYLQFVMRASNDGEGGVFALYGLLYKFRKNRKVVLPTLTALILAAGFLFGDGMITPAISVLSAVEGLKFSYPNLTHMIVPMAMAILVGLFLIQRKGTHNMGRFFGPILLVWFIAIGYFGFRQVLQHPQILKAINPYYGLTYLKSCSLQMMLFVLGGVVLAITGGEALYADMGHFDVRSIRRSWFIIVFPALILNYLGQGAFLLSQETVQFSNIFYSSISVEYRWPMLILATIATVVASQALISGVYSLTTQAVALGLFPRLKIRYTHEKHVGQVYVPLVNWFLLLGCLALVYTFKASQNLASAYGLAVSADMFFTSVTMFILSQLLWEWSLTKRLLIFGLFGVIDFAFLFANSFKFIEGGYIPFLIGLGLFGVMTTWRWGRRSTYAAYSAVKTDKISQLIEAHRQQKTFLQKNMLLLVPKPLVSVDQNVPALMKMVFERYGLLAANLFFVEIVHVKTPYVYRDGYDVRVFEKNPNGIIASVVIKFGFMDDPNVEQVLEGLARHHLIQLDPEPGRWVFHVSQELLKTSGETRFLARVRLALYGLLRQISRPAYVYYGLGDRVQLSVQIITVKI